MIIRLLALLAAIGLTSATALAQTCDEAWPFDRSFSSDAPGGQFETGEDEAVSARFDELASVTAHFQILVPHRTEAFGSGVAFWLCSEDGRKAVRVAFNDREDQDKLSLRVVRFNDLDDPDARSDTLAEAALSIPKRNAAKVSLKKDAKGRVTIKVDGRSFRIDGGFVPSRVMVQIFCARGWAQFSDDALF